MVWAKYTAPLYNWVSQTAPVQAFTFFFPPANSSGWNFHACPWCPETDIPVAAGEPRLAQRRNIWAVSETEVKAVGAVLPTQALSEDLFPPWGSRGERGWVSGEWGGQSQRTAVTCPHGKPPTFGVHSNMKPLHTTSRSGYVSLAFLRA